MSSGFAAIEILFSPFHVSRTHWNDAIFPRNRFYTRFFSRFSSLWGANETGNLSDFHTGAAADRPDAPKWWKFRRLSQSDDFRENYCSSELRITTLDPRLRLIWCNFAAGKLPCGRRISANRWNARISIGDTRSLRVQHWFSLTNLFAKKSQIKKKTLLSLSWSIDSTSSTVFAFHYSDISSSRAQLGGRIGRETPTDALRVANMHFSNGKKKGFCDFRWISFFRWLSCSI